MSPFATVADLEARWRELSQIESDRAQVLLGDASALLRSICADIDEAVDDGTLDPDVLKFIACNMVKRSMSVSDDAFGVSSFQESVGPFSQSRSFASPSGDLYISRSERKLLPCFRVKAYTISTALPVRRFWHDW